MIAAGEFGQLARIDTATWKAVSLAKVEGTVNSLAVHGMSYAVGVAAFEKSQIVIRSGDDVQIASIPTSRNARVAWSPDGKRLVARIESDVDHPEEQLAFVDVARGSLSLVDLGAVDSVAASFSADGKYVLAFVRRPELDSHVLRIGLDGRVKELGTIDCLDAFAQLLPLGDDRFLLRPYNDPWRIVNGRGEGLVEGPRRVHHGCIDGEGFATAYSAEITRWTADGKPRKKVKAKKRVEGLASIGGKLLVQEPGRLALL